MPHRRAAPGPPRHISRPTASSYPAQNRLDRVRQAPVAMAAHRAVGRVLHGHPRASSSPRAGHCRTVPRRSARLGHHQQQPGTRSSRRPARRRTNQTAHPASPGHRLPDARHDRRSASPGPRRPTGRRSRRRDRHRARNRDPGSALPDRNADQRPPRRTGPRRRLRPARLRRRATDRLRDGRTPRHRSRPAHLPDLQRYRHVRRRNRLCLHPPTAHRRQQREPPGD